MKIRWDGTRRRWHERLLRFDQRGQCWLPWHWRLNGSATGADPWFGWHQ